jgi:hypothetical protein
MKIHHEPLGIFALLFIKNIPIENVNFLNKQATSYYWQQFKNKGITLHLGVQIDRDVQVTRVLEKENIFTFLEINLEIKLENNQRCFRPLDGANSDEWLIFQDDIFVEYQPCKSLIDVR